MGLAVVGLLFNYIGTTGIAAAAWIWILLGTLIGGLLGAVLAQRVPMTSMPETVALFNGCGGMSSLLVALRRLAPGTPIHGFVALVSIVVSVFVGAITFRVRSGDGQAPGLVVHTGMDAEPGTPWGQHRLAVISLIAAGRCW